MISPSADGPARCHSRPQAGVAAGEDVSTERIPCCSIAWTSRDAERRGRRGASDIGRGRRREDRLGGRPEGLDGEPRSRVSRGSEESLRRPAPASAGLRHTLEGPCA